MKRPKLEDFEASTQVTGPYDLPAYVDQMNKYIDHLESQSIPDRLTAENGAKALLNGEFYESVSIENPEYCGCEICYSCEHDTGCEEYIEIKVPVKWTTIKNVYAKIVEHFKLKEQ
jgi:hypothetical protein